MTSASLSDGRFTASRNRGRFHSVFCGKMLPQPVVNAVFLAGIHYSLPANIACPFVILSDYILSSGQNGNRAIDPEPATKI